MSRAFIVWNEAKNEGVIFVDDGYDYGPECQTAEEDAEQAATGNKSRAVTSSLAEAFSDSYSDGECPVQVVSDVNNLYALS